MSKFGLEANIHDSIDHGCNSNLREKLLGSEKLSYHVKKNILFIYIFITSRHYRILNTFNIGSKALSS